MVAIRFGGCSSKVIRILIMFNLGELAVPFMMSRALGVMMEKVNRGTILGLGGDLVDGNWHKWEIYIKYNTDGSGEGHSNGILTVWVDDVERIHRTWIRPICTSGGKISRMSFGYFHNILTSSSGWQIDDIEIWDGIPNAIDINPPSLSNSQPTGTLSSGTTQTTISLTTDETAECKYGTLMNVPYDSITNTFSSTNSTTHSQTITGLSDGNTCHYYVRCQDESGNQNPDDFEISFSVASPPHTVYGLSNFIQLVADWLKSESGLTSDVNGDGVVNTRDLGIMMSNWQN